ncbi:hypothetical protein [Chryseobacterium sp. 5_R23647]|uniref:hypothetical protein n=1 Tax=Chryseobacterium sp. 5_R23647 TaxID=2258964 RepID=UPI000E27DF57|nr:hypothetical protein [Chryseobacterium sp. 5_R23647]REC40501.1 hypothetical protein DRF69_18580 [Chryseobacterium sp. 5_R23647]
MKKIKILISTYTEEIQMSDFCPLYFDTPDEALSFLHLFYESLSSERAMVIQLGDNDPLIYQYTDGYFPFEEVEIELKNKFFANK